MTSRGIFGRKLLDIEVRERELGSPGPGQVIVKVRACGVCGTDVNFVRDWTGEPMPLGHEIAAEVVEVGPGVTRLAPADRVIVEDCSMCGTCEHCKAGHPGLCRTMFTLDGQPGMGELLLVPHNSLVKFDGLDFPEASLTEPLAVSLTSVLNADIPLGGSVLVLGNGPLGLMSALLARMRGAGFVAIAGRGADTPLRAARRAAAEKAGFDMVLTGSVGDLKEKIHSRFPAGVDRVIVSSPPASIQDALALIRFGGIITFYGLHLGGANVLPVDFAHPHLRRARGQFPRLDPAPARGAHRPPGNHFAHLRILVGEGNPAGHRGGHPPCREARHGFLGRLRFAFSRMRRAPRRAR
jgi:threonine dehydrogenase-like Zn-dependent dehydrogenase